MFSTLHKTNFNLSVNFILSSANIFYLDQSKILSFGKGLSFRERLTKINEEENSGRYETKKENADDMKYIEGKRGRLLTHYSEFISICFLSKFGWERQRDRHTDGHPFIYDRQTIQGNPSLTLYRMTQFCSKIEKFVSSRVENIVRKG